MRNGFRFFLTAVIGAAVCTLVARAADDPPKFKTYTFETTDGVKLDGDLYTNAGSANPKDATVLLLHDLDLTKGSSRADPGWDKLAERLQKEGYSVFAFDFRGFGKSTDVTDKFWDHVKNPQNQMVKGWNKVPPPESISYKGFEHGYYPQLVNDVAAAKSWLDKNPAVNTSSFFLIGAGEGAAIGAAWMDTEWHRQKCDVDALGTPMFDPKTRKLMLQDPEGVDEAGAVWLSISPTIGGRNYATSIHSWVGEAGGAKKVPVGLYYGAEDETGKNNSTSALKSIYSNYRLVNAPEATDEVVKGKLEHTTAFGIKETKLSGNKLLLDDLPTTDAIVKFLDPVMQKRRNVQARTHDDKAALFWTFPSAPTVPIQAKSSSDSTLPLIPVARFMKGS